MNILLIEDDEVDCMAMRRALRDSAINSKVVEASNGIEAMEILHADEADSALPSPLLILLDINMPMMNGHEFLHKLRHEETNPEIRDAVVFILTTSKAEEDRTQAYKEHVAGYIVKPDYALGLSKVVKMLKAYDEAVDYP
jgi:CheY-like chemotaxis protein